MFKSLHSTSFAYGVLAAVLLTCVLGAAKNDVRKSPKYDVIGMGLVGLGIVDHDTNFLYLYELDVKNKDAKDKVGACKLHCKIDLSLTGKTEIPVGIAD